MQCDESVESIKRMLTRLTYFLFLTLCLSVGMLSLSGCLAKYKLSLISIPDNGGSANISPQASDFNSGTIITVVAQPSPGWRFSRWSGDIQKESGNKAAIVMDKDKSVSVYFVKTYVLSLSIDPKGAGMLSADSGNYDSGNEVIITPQAFYGWSFDRWEGDVASSNDQIIVKMDRDKKIIARFIKDESEQR
jgi:hypothetical protein